MKFKAEKPPQQQDTRNSLTLPKETFIDVTCTKMLNLALISFFSRAVAARPLILVRLATPSAASTMRADICRRKKRRLTTGQKTTANLTKMSHESPRVCSLMTF